MVLLWQPLWLSSVVLQQPRKKVRSVKMLSTNSPDPLYQLCLSIYFIFLEKGAATRFKQTSALRFIPVLPSQKLAVVFSCGAGAVCDMCVTRAV